MHNLYFLCFLRGSIAGSFTPPAVMCCPWLALKEDLEAVAVDTGNTRLNTSSFKGCYFHSLCHSLYDMTVMGLN